jgi:hypothetical protein
LKKPKTINEQNKQTSKAHSNVSEVPRLVYIPPGKRNFIMSNYGIAEDTKQMKFCVKFINIEYKWKVSITKHTGGCSSKWHLVPRTGLFLI